MSPNSCNYTVKHWKIEQIRRMRKQLMHGTLCQNSLLILLRQGMGNAYDKCDKHVLCTILTKTSTSLYSSLNQIGEVKSSENANCVYVTNDGLRSITQPKKRTIDAWNKIKASLKQNIVNEF